MSEERAHHDYSPSTLQSLEACPCWQSKQSEKPHPRTVIGTISHGVAETGEDDPRLSDEDAIKVAECVDFYEKRRERMQSVRNDAVKEIVRNFNNSFEIEAAYLLAEGRVAPIIELKETYLSIDDVVFIDCLRAPYGDGTPREVRATSAGYIDWALIDHSRTYAELGDWKFGFWPVEQADNNLQAITYSLGLFRKYPTLNSIRFFFKQPNIDYITDALFTRENIPALYLRVQTVVARARIARHAGDFAVANPMIPACNFCAHIGRCPAVTKIACNVGSKFYPIEIPADITPSKVHNPEDTKLGLQLAGVLEVWAKAFRGIVTDRVIRRDAEPPEGYKLESRTPREIVDNAKYKEVALQHLTEAEYSATLKPVFGSVEELISNKAPRGQKKVAVEKFGEEIEACGAVKRGSPYTFLSSIPKTNKK